MGLVDVLPSRHGRPSVNGGIGLPDVAILEDETHAADLAVDVCGGLQLTSATYRTPASFLADFLTVAPRVVILDWRLERDVGAAVFMALRHRFATVPIVCWTGQPPESLPAMVAADALCRIVQKASGVGVFEDAIRWAASLPDVPS